MSDVEDTRKLYAEKNAGAVPHGGNTYVVDAAEWDRMKQQIERVNRPSGVGAFFAGIAKPIVPILAAPLNVMVGILNVFVGLWYGIYYVIYGALVGAFIAAFAPSAFNVVERRCDAMGRNHKDDAGNCFHLVFMVPAVLWCIVLAFMVIIWLAGGMCNHPHLTKFTVIAASTNVLSGLHELGQCMRAKGKTVTAKSPA